MAQCARLQSERSCTDRRFESGLRFHINTQVAQTAERGAVNAEVPGSMPGLSIACGIGGRIRTGDRYKTSRFAGERIEPLCYSDMVWVEGFEPSASWFQARYSLAD